MRIVCIGGIIMDCHEIMGGMCLAPVITGFGEWHVI